MSSVFDSPFVQQRLQWHDEQRFGRCDCTSYSYFVLSMVLFSVGTVITVLALGSTDGYVLSNLGHMWLVGPIFICSGMMVAVKSMLYLRRKSVIQVLLHQRSIIRDMATMQAEQNYGVQVPRNSSTATLPPAYDALIPVDVPCTADVEPPEPPPPTYDEAMNLIDDEKVHTAHKTDGSPKQNSSRAHISLDNRKP